MTQTYEYCAEETAFVFPGQASQKVGMGYDLYLSSEAAREVFEEVDHALGRSLHELIFDVDMSELTLTRNTQPAIAAVSIAAWRALEECSNAMQIPRFAAGHSIGEYSALAVTGVLSITDTIRLVAERGRLMEEACIAHPGGMAAIIGIDEETVAEVCRLAGAYVSNINTTQQIIISGDTHCLAQAMDLAARRGAKRAIKLKVGGAFHSSLMRPAQDSLNAMIDSLEFRDPLAPVVSNVSAEPLTTGEDIKAELKAQLQSCVRWSDSIDWMVDQNIKTFVEIGPGSVLSGMIKRTVPEARISHIDDLASIKRYIELCEAHS